MSLVHFSELMRHAEKHAYAVGYFESWNIGSLLAVADAAELTAKAGSVTRRAHAAGAVAEGELAPLPGAGGEVVDDTQQRSPKRDVAGIRTICGEYRHRRIRGRYRTASL